MTDLPPFRDWADRNAEQVQTVEDKLYSEFPQLVSLLETDVHREKLRVLFKCPRGHPIETMVLDVDGNWHLYLQTLSDYQSREPMESQSLENETPFSGRAAGYLGRLKVPCPHPRCRYDGRLTQAELLKLFAIARFVLNTPDIRIPF